ncbi:MAG: T9SS type A sorting domain-containing protein [Candidatus Cloacimonetes bacterium]|nr:T9SS type A sorting domain-containing protein [Candidatus Cloacimonadota bacterium]
MKVIKAVALALLQCITVFMLYAQQPNVMITLDNSIPIPYPYDEVMKLPSGDLQFYKINTDIESIQVTGFQYLLQTNTLTDVVQIGNVTGIQGECQHEFSTQRFGKFYSVYQYPDSYNPQGLVILRMDANVLEFRIIDEITLGSDFNGHDRIDIVSENSFVFALEDSLVYYNFISNTSQKLLDGVAYQCSPLQDKRVYSMPDGHFMYVKDSRMGYNTVPETWIIYDSQGIYQFTKTITDPWFGVSTIGVSFNHDFNFVNERFYIHNPGIIYDEAYLECHFPSPDSLHYYVVPAPGSLNEGSARFVRFGDDRILRSYYDYFEDQTYLYMNFSPLESNPVPSDWFCFGYLKPNINGINDNIVVISVRLAESIYLSALCTLDFPVSHTFTFPAPHAYIPSNSMSFSYDDKLYFIDNNIIFTFNVELSVSNVDETATPPVFTLSVYPNPVNVKDVIKFKASIKHPMELDIYNIRGQRVSTVKLDSDGSGQWDLHNHNGEALSAGVYIAIFRNHKGIKPVRFIAIH